MKCIYVNALRFYIFRQTPSQCVQFFVCCIFQHVRYQTESCHPIVIFTEHSWWMKLNYSLVLRSQKKAPWWIRNMRCGDKEHFTKSKSLNKDCDDLLYNPLVIWQNCYTILVEETCRGISLTPYPCGHTHTSQELNMFLLHLRTLSMALIRTRLLFQIK